MVTYFVADAILQLALIKLFLSLYLSKMFPGGEKHVPQGGVLVSEEL